MKKILLFSLGILPVFVGLKAQNITLPAVSASITFTNPTTQNNMSLVIDGGEGYTEVATIGGVACRKVPSGKFMYVSCNRGTIPTTERNLLIAVTYYANSNNNIWFNYNSTTNNYQGADFQKTLSNTWATAIIPITDGALAGSLLGGGDFRLGYGSEDNYIKEIKVYKGILDPTAQAIPANPNSAISGFKNKSFAGYQVWHKAGPNAADWSHWAYGQVPHAGFHVGEDIASFPDISEIPDAESYATGFANLGNGKPTRLYTDGDASIINRQMGWLQDKGLDGVAIQRFVGSPLGKSVTITSTSPLTNIKTACEATGRLFYICYDLNGTDADILKRMQTDWVYEIEQIRALTSSPNYATVNGKPVVEMWGVGYDMATAAQCTQLISFFKSRGCYVIGGTPNAWRSGPGTGFSDVFKSLDCVSPWTVGIYNSSAGANGYLTNNMVPDKAYCDQNGMDYLPVAFAGGANWVNNDLTLSQTDREGGKFLWQQVYNAKTLGLTSVYLAMLDEFEESTNLINGAVDYFDIPTDQYFETFAKDGVWTSSDYYLRLAATASKMLRGEVPLTQTIPVQYSLGPTYHRNSFESRATTVRTETRSVDKTLKIDPCFFNAAVVTNTGITNPSVAIVNETSFTKSGLYSVKITGTANSASSANYYYKTNDVKIGIKANMQLSFWKYSVNALGQYTAVDLNLKSGKKLHSLTGYNDNNGSAMSPTIARGTIGSWQKFTCQIGKGELIGDTIVGIVVGYDHPAASGSITAYIDDIIIEDATDTSAPVLSPVISSAAAASGTVGTAFTYSITASNTPTQYGAPGLPAGLTVNTTTGVISGTPTAAGTYSVTISAGNGNGTGTQLLTITIASVTGLTPYGGTPSIIPGKIEAENYDNGGEGIAYHDTDTLNHGGFRPAEFVDAENTGDTGGGYNVGFTAVGEWMKYTVNVVTPGAYTLQVRLASPSPNSGKSLHVELDGQNISGPINITSNTADWQTYQTISVAIPMITTGQKVLRIFEDTDGFNLNYINFVQDCSTGTNVWTGAVSTAWETAGNWSCGSVPTINSNVYINSGTIVVNSTVSIRSLNASPAANITVTSGNRLNVVH
ncbi:MAG: carbohydrate-binding protein [Sphingobacteriales bacterium]|nr:carbohydrate-binding protein [Sphingobacteriales bacterium]